jgi:hypothetical protein
LSVGGERILFVLELGLYSRAHLFAPLDRFRDRVALGDLRVRPLQNVVQVVVLVLRLDRRRCLRGWRRTFEPFGFTADAVDTCLVRQLAGDVVVNRAKRVGALLERLDLLVDRGCSLSSPLIVPGARFFFWPFNALIADRLR